MAGNGLGAEPDVRATYEPTRQRQIVPKFTACECGNPLQRVWSVPGMSKAASTPNRRNTCRVANLFDECCDVARADHHVRVLVTQRRVLPDHQLTKLVEVNRCGRLVLKRYAVIIGPIEVIGVGVKADALRCHMCGT